MCKWYDGFTFDNKNEMFNPWSITCYLQWSRLKPYWANSSSNSLVGELIRQGGNELKTDFEKLLAGDSVRRQVNEFVSYRTLRYDSNAVWSLLLATGYLRVAGHDDNWDSLELALTNLEVRMAFDALVREWFVAERGSYNDFVKALLACDSVSMEEYLSDLATGVMSSFDSGVRPSRRLPERFWHGLVLGLIVELRGRNEVRSNPQSGMGRCDVLLAPLDGPDGKDLAFVIEFKVFDKRRGEKTLKDTVTSACQQIEQKGYATTLAERSILTSRIRYLGIGFRGQEVKVDEGALHPQY